MESSKSRKENEMKIEYGDISDIEPIEFKRVPWGFIKEKASYAVARGVLLSCWYRSYKTMTTEKELHKIGWTMEELEKECLTEEAKEIYLSGYIPYSTACMIATRRFYESFGDDLVKIAIEQIRKE